MNEEQVNGSVSVVITTFKRPAYLKEALHSVFDQTLQPQEIVISDDGDDQETINVIESYMERGITIRHVRNTPSLGQLANRQQAFQLSRGTFVAILDDDDRWEPTFLEKTYNALVENPQCSFCSADHYIMGPTGEILSKDTEMASNNFGRSRMSTGIVTTVLLEVLRTKPFSLHTTLFRREVLEVNGFFPSHAGTIPDFALMATLGVARVSAYYIAERLGRYRVHEGQQTMSRVENSASVVNFLQVFIHQAQLTSKEKRMVSSLYRRTVIEMAIAHAHLMDTGEAIRALQRYNNLGFGLPKFMRLTVLILLLVGIRPSRSSHLMT